MLRGKAGTGWFVVLVLLIGALPPGARGQQITATATANWADSGMESFGSLGNIQDSVNVIVNGQITMAPDTNDDWVIVSSNYTVLVSGMGMDPGALGGDSWTWVEFNPNDAQNDAAVIQLEFDDNHPETPFDFGSVNIVLFSPGVGTSPPNAPTLFDNPVLVPLPNTQLTVPADNGAFSVSGSESTNAIPLIEDGVSITGTVTASYTVSYQPASTNLTLISVKTPATADGNQHTFISTDTITVKASIAGHQGGIPVTWSVTGLNGASPATVATNVVVNSDSTGVSTFSFSPADSGAFVHFRKSHFTMTGSKAPNPPLSFDVTAASQGKTVTLSQSAAGTLMQDDVDTLRQEYVDYNTYYQSASYTPQRADVVPSLGKNAPLKYNGGNYGVQLSDGLDTAYQTILQNYQGSTITIGGVTATIPANAQVSISSGYRNPQYNKIISKYPQTSIHMFGGALDLVPEATQVFINGQLKNCDIHQVLYPALKQAASLYGTAISEFNAIPVPLGCSQCLTITNTMGVVQSVSENHIHVQW